jgi:Cu-Zn family superoxide dismutase
MKKAASFFAFILFAAACASMRTGPMAGTTIRPTSGSTAMGMVHFQEMSDGSVEVQVDLTGVPAGVHGFHIHEMGDCGDEGKSAGAHFNPLSMPHAGPDSASRHAGDFGNVTAGENGEVHSTFITRSVTVREGTMSVVGRAVVLHRDRDDLRTQPSGNAGEPIACGVVQSHLASSMQR